MHLLFGRCNTGQNCAYYTWYLRVISDIREQCNICLRFTRFHQSTCLVKMNLKILARRGSEPWPRHQTHHSFWMTWKRLQNHSRHALYYLCITTQPFSASRHAETLYYISNNQTAEVHLHNRVGDFPGWNKSSIYGWLDDTAFGLEKSDPTIPQKLSLLKTWLKWHQLRNGKPTKKLSVWPYHKTGVKSKREDRRSILLLLSICISYEASQCIRYSSTQILETARESCNWALVDDMDWTTVWWLAQFESSQALQSCRCATHQPWPVH